MSGAPQVPPGLEPDAPRPKRTRAASVGATPSGSSPLGSSAPTSVLVSFGPGWLGLPGGRQSPEIQNHLHGLLGADLRRIGLPSAPRGPAPRVLPRPPATACRGSTWAL
eukprot:11440320-Alexandrium_andersonii.AAC.1